MKVYFLHSDPKRNVAAHADIHVSGMPQTYAQILCNVFHMKRDQLSDQAKEIVDDRFYNPQQIEHPINTWAASTPNNFFWLAMVSNLLNQEYTRRFDNTLETVADMTNAVHKMMESLNFPYQGFTSLPIKVTANEHLDTKGLATTALQTDYGTHIVFDEGQDGKKILTATTRIHQQRYVQEMKQKQGKKRLEQLYTKIDPPQFMHSLGSKIIVQ